MAQEPNTKPITEETPFERFERLARKIVNTPKSKIEADKKARARLRRKSPARY